VSGLQCPATLLIARHGDAGYADDAGSDGGWLTELGRAQVSELVESLRSRRIAAVYSSRMKGAVDSGELAATELGVKPLAVDGLHEFSVGELGGASYLDPRAQRVFDAWLHGDLDAACPGAEDGHVVVKRFRKALQEIADIHRGETVLVFSHGGAMSLTIPRLSVNVRNDLAAQRFLPGCAAAEVEVDADGWRIVSWPGSADPATI
jgi:2,3-bisphosphoglycerate-dependent phosphoglycerate mutase